MKSAEAQLDGIDAGYAELQRSAALAAWQEATGGEKQDRQRLEEAQEQFLTDASLGRQLNVLLDAPEAEARLRARSWLRYRQLATLGLLPRLREIRAHIRREIADTSDENNAKPLWALYAGEDGAARRLALSTLSDKTARVAPLLLERAGILQRAAADAGASSYAQLFGYPGSFSELEQVCASQLSATEPGWLAFLANARVAQPEGVGLADYLALATRRNQSAGAFLKSADLPRLVRAALACMGFDLDALGIQIVHSTQRPGGSAHGVSIPDDVRFAGHFPDGFEGARGYFHELGHAVHMKSIRARFLPMRMLPQNSALTEGVAEIFTLPLRQRSWLAAELSGVSPEELDEFERATAAFDAVATRYNCLHALIELALFDGVPFEDAFRHALQRTFQDTAAPPVYVLTPYLTDSLSSVAYVYAAEVKLEFQRRLSPRALLSPEGGAFLRRLLEPGNGLSFAEWWRP